MRLKDAEDRDEVYCPGQHHDADKEQDRPLERVAAIFEPAREQRDEYMQNSQRDAAQADQGKTIR
jgi:hypothetical protein